MSSEATESSGVQQLIDRLHEQGVAKGKQESEELVTAARQQAADTLDKAKREAEEIVASAAAEAKRVRAAGEEAIRLAGRDTILKMTEELREDFTTKLRHLIGRSLKDTEFLKQLILEIARSSVPQSAEADQKVNILLLQERDQDDESGLDDFVRSLGGEALRDGLTMEIANSDVPGVRVQVVDDNLEIDLTTQTLTKLLMQHLSPRFRTILNQ